METGELVATGAFAFAFAFALVLALAPATCGCTFWTGREVLCPATRSSTGIGPSGREVHAESKQTDNTLITIQLWRPLNNFIPYPSGDTRF
jgi:hypothetical protein